MANPERRMAPLPLAQAFVICREIWEDCRTHECMLVGPLSSLFARAFPLASRLSIYAHVTGGHGDYNVSLHLRDTEDRELWEWRFPEPIPLHSPLEPHSLTLHDAIFEFPEPGRYDLLLFANGGELARHAIRVIDRSKVE